MIKDYRSYQMNHKEIFICLLEGLGFDLLISVIFYDSILAMIPGIILIYFYFREKKRKLMRKRMHDLKIQFREFLNILIAVLQTGRSLENAFAESLKDTRQYLGKETVFIKEMKRICAGVGVGEPLEKLLLDFSYRCHMEEMEYFAEVLSIGKRSGGNLIGIMKNTIRMLQERMEAEEEILTVLAEKKLEFYVMSMIPFGIMIYLRIGAGNMVSCLYGNVTGIAVMTVCLLIYGGCYLYGKRLLEIENR